MLDLAIHFQGCLNTLHLFEKIETERSRALGPRLLSVTSKSVFLCSWRAADTSLLMYNEAEKVDNDKEQVVSHAFGPKLFQCDPM